jgi:hypothetical protein
LILLLGHLPLLFERRPGIWILYAILDPVLVAVIVFMATWEWRDRLKGSRAYLGNLEGAIRANRAIEDRIEAPAMISFEEIEDEGLSYAYQVEPNVVLFLSIGQEYELDRRVRCDAFSIVQILGPKDLVFDSYVAKHGMPLSPARVISAEEQKALGFGRGSRLPVGTFPGRLDDIEEILKIRSGSHGDVHA